MLNSRVSNIAINSHSRDLLFPGALVALGMVQKSHNRLQSTSSIECNLNLDPSFLLRTRNLIELRAKRISVTQGA